MQTISKDRVHDVPIIFIFQQKYSTFTAFVMVNKLVDVPPAVAPLSAKSLRNFLNRFQHYVQSQFKYVERNDHAP